jgi:hypothetical protein
MRKLAVHSRHLIELASAQPLLNCVPNPKCIGDDSEGGIDRTDGRKKASIGDIKILQIMCSAVDVQHRGTRVSAEAGGTSLMGRPADRNVLPKIKAALYQNRMCAGPERL